MDPGLLAGPRFPVSLGGLQTMTNGQPLDFADAFRRLAKTFRGGSLMGWNRLLGIYAHVRIDIDTDVGGAVTIGAGRRGIRRYDIELEDCEIKAAGDPRVLQPIHWIERGYVLPPDADITAEGWPAAGAAGVVRRWELPLIEFYDPSLDNPYDIAPSVAALTKVGKLNFTVTAGAAADIQSAVAIQGLIVQIQLFAVLEPHAKFFDPVPMDIGHTGTFSTTRADIRGGRYRTLALLNAPNNAAGGYDDLSGMGNIFVESPNSQAQIIAGREDVERHVTYQRLVNLDGPRFFIDDASIGDIVDMTMPHRSLAVLANIRWLDLARRSSRNRSTGAKYELVFPDGNTRIGWDNATTLQQVWKRLEPGRGRASQKFADSKGVTVSSAVALGADGRAWTSAEKARRPWVDYVAHAVPELSMDEKLPPRVTEE